jgi:hypothetical protein
MPIAPSDASVDVCHAIVPPSPMHLCVAANLLALPYDAGILRTDSDASYAIFWTSQFRTKFSGFDPCRQPVDMLNCLSIMSRSQMFRDLLADVMPAMLLTLVLSSAAVSAAAGLALVFPR